MDTLQKRYVLIMRSYTLIAVVGGLYSETSSYLYQRGNRRVSVSAEENAPTLIGEAMLDGSYRLWDGEKWTVFGPDDIFPIPSRLYADKNLGYTSDDQDDSDEYDDENPFGSDEAILDAPRSIPWRLWQELRWLGPFSLLDEILHIIEEKIPAVTRFFEDTTPIDEDESRASLQCRLRWRYCNWSHLSWYHLCRRMGKWSINNKSQT